jgi:hypothetical protein
MFIKDHEIPDDDENSSKHVGLLTLKYTQINALKSRLFVFVYVVIFVHIIISPLSFQSEQSE